MTELYGELSSESIAVENMKCREIVKEIMLFGVNQRQIYMLLYLLSAELENIDHMQELMNAIREMREDTHLTKTNDAVT